MSEQNFSTVANDDCKADTQAIALNTNIKVGFQDKNLRISCLAPTKNDGFEIKDIKFKNKKQLNSNEPGNIKRQNFMQKLRTGKTSLFGRGKKNNQNNKENEDVIQMSNQKNNQAKSVQPNKKFGNITADQNDQIYFNAIKQKRSQNDNKIVQKENSQNSANSTQIPKNNDYKVPTIFTQVQKQQIVK